MISMRRSILCAICLSTMFVLSPSARSGDDDVFKGVIADSQCAFNVHSLNQSHEEMLKTNKVGVSEADCVWACVKERGGLFVLQNKKKVYRLDDQSLDYKFAAQEVEVTGTLDPKTDTIHVLSIKLVPKATKAPPPSH
jgi:hypothetical protein